MASKSSAAVLRKLAKMPTFEQMEKQYDEDQKKIFLEGCKELIPKLERMDHDPKNFGFEQVELATRPELTSKSKLSALVHLAEQTFKPCGGISFQERWREINCFAPIKRRSVGYRQQEDEAGKGDIEMEPMTSKSPYITSVQDAEVRYGTTDEQLAYLARKVVPVAKDGNCMFASVAKQIKYCEEYQNPRTLRFLAVEQGRRHPERYEHFLEGDRKRFLTELEKLDQDGVWDLAVGDLAITMLHDALKYRIAVISDRNKPLIFPDDNKEINDLTIVIVKNNYGWHYDATKPMKQFTTTAGREQEQIKHGNVPMYGSELAQLAAIGRRVDKVKDMPNSLYISISRQLEDPKLTPQRLRAMVYSAAREQEEEYIEYTPFDSKDYQTIIKLMKKDGYNEKHSNKLALRILSEELGVKIVVIEHCRKRVHYPDDGKMVDRDAIVIAVQRLGSDQHHYHATKIRTRQKEYPSAEIQIAEMNRKIEEVNDHGPNSMFFALAFQMSEYDIVKGMQWMRLHVSSYGSDQLAKYFMKHGAEYPEQERAAKFLALREDGVFFESLAAPIAHIVQKMYDLKVIVVRDFQRPWYFPYDDQRPIQDDTLVIVQRFHKDGSTYYLPTTSLSWKDQEEKYQPVLATDEDWEPPKLRKGPMSSLKKNLTKDRRPKLHHNRPIYKLTYVESDSEDEGTYTLG